MGCASQCGVPGGPWIDVDPDCPIHGYEAQRAEKQLEQERREQEEREEELVEQLKEANSRLEILGAAFLSMQEQKTISWIKLSDKAPVPGLIVKRFKDGSVWAGPYKGTKKETDFDEYIQLPN